MENLDTSQLDYESLTALRRRLFVDALFANGFRTADAMKHAGFKGKNLADRGRVLARRDDVQADIRERFKTLEQEDPRFSGKAILHEMAEVAYLEINDDTLSQKVRALELLGKNQKLFSDRETLTADDMNKLTTNMGLVVNQVVSQLVTDPELVSTINTKIREGWLALRV